MLERTTQGISSLLEEQLLPATCAEMGAAGRNPALFPARSSQDLSIIAVYDWLFALRVSKKRSSSQERKSGSAEEQEQDTSTTHRAPWVREGEMPPRSPWRGSHPAVFIHLCIA